MIKCERKGNRSDVEIDGDKLTLIFEMMTIFSACIDRILPEEAVESFIDDLPSLIRMHRAEIISRTVLDQTAIDKAKKEESHNGNNL